MDNTRASALHDIVEKQDFIENPLDQYNSYTYNLEWFVVDVDMDREFHIHEGFSMIDIVNDKWPSQNDNYIAIAKTGVSTEFNITDLTIESVHAGNATNSKIAGTAVSLSFNVTQVGETSLVDNLQNAVALSGYHTIADATFYIKINFVGHDEKGVPLKIENTTKVIPFNISRFADLSTSTDQRGTTTVIEGIIPADKTVMSTDISMTEDNFTYRINDTLKETLDSFILNLNESVAKAHPTLDAGLQHTYKCSFSKPFYDWAGNSNMIGKMSHGSQNMEKGEKENTAQNVGQVMPAKDIYEILLEICINAKTIKDELTKSKREASKLFKITPWLIRKKDGYNPVKGTWAYEIEYFINYEKEPIIQNISDQFDKALHARETIQAYFDDLHVGKKYDYLFTGKNDQVLNFDISLDATLTKVYSVPSDYYALDHFLSKNNIEGKLISKEKQKVVDKAAAEYKELNKWKGIASTELKKHKDTRAEIKASYKHDLVNAYVKQMGGMSPPEIAEMFGGKSLEYIMTLVGLEEDGDVFGDLKYSEIKENMKKYDDQVKKALGGYLKLSSLTSKSEEWKDRVLYDAYGGVFSGKFNRAYRASKNVYDDIIFKDKDRKNITLIEELDNDIVSKISNEEYKIILKAQSDNPITFQRLIQNLDEDKNYTIKSTNPENLNLARQKYYESKQYNISMMRATLGIKGDPYWLEGYMPPAIKLDEFGISGGRPGLNAMTTINGGNGLVLVANVSDGVDVNDNILKRNIITTLYQVIAITSSFAGGLFTQSLSMIKKPEAEWLNPELNTEIEIQEFDSNVKLTNGPVIDDHLDVVARYTNLEDETTMGKPVLIPSDAPTGTQGIVTRMIDDHIEANLAHNLAQIVAYSGKTLGEIYSNVTRTLTKPIKKFFNSTLGENASTYNTEHEGTAENYVAAVAQQTAPNLSFEANALDRQNHAAAYLNEYRFMDNLCKHQKEGDKTSCEAKDNAQNDILSVFVDANNDPLTVADRGDPAAAALINQQVNDMLAANPNVTVSPYEVAAWQHAIGYELDICRPGTESCFTSANDKRWTEDHIKYKTGDRTPIQIMDEQNNYEIPPVDVSGQSGAINDNRILDGSLPLNDEIVDGILINEKPLPIKTMVEIKEEYEAIYEDTSETAACDEACRTKKAILLTKDVQALAYAEYYADETVEEIVKNAEPFVPHVKRTLKVVKVPKNTLTDIEMNDINILSEEMSGLFQNHELTPADQNKQMVWTDEGYKLLEREIETSDLSISEVDKSTLQTAIADSVAESVLLGSLSDNEYLEIQGYETGINTVILDAQDGHRGDLTTAVNVGLNEDELAILNEQRTETITNLNQFHWDTDGRRIFEEELDSIDVTIAKNTLSQFDEHMTAVASICSGSTCEYVPIYNPTKKDDHTTAIIKNADEQFDVVLAGVDNAYAGVTTQNNIDQLTQARNVYYALTSTASGNMTTVEDDWGLEIEVKDFSNISPIIYTDANGVTQTIANPSNEFQIHTTSYSDIVPGYKQDYKLLREKVADLFPNIEVISNIDLNGIALTLSTLKDDTGMIIMQGTAFYINP